MQIDLHIDRQSTPERIAEALRSAILSGALRPGTSLREAAISASVGASRNTVREALRLLSNEGLVTHNRYRGVTVTELDEHDVVDIFRARLALELAGVDAAVSAAPEKLAAVAAAARALEEVIEREDWQAAFEHDIGLHAAVVATLGSARLEEYFVALMRELRLGYLMFGGLETESMAIDREEHQRIATLITEGEREACRQLISAHIARSQQLLNDLMRSRREGLAEREEPRAAAPEKKSGGRRRGM